MENEKTNNMGNVNLYEVHHRFNAAIHDLQDKIRIPEKQEFDDVMTCLNHAYRQFSLGTISFSQGENEKFMQHMISCMVYLNSVKTVYEDHKIDSYNFRKTCETVDMIRRHYFSKEKLEIVTV